MGATRKTWRRFLSSTILASALFSSPQLLASMSPQQHIGVQKPIGVLQPIGVSLNDKFEDVGEVSGLIISEEEKDAESELFEELQREKKWHQEWHKMSTDSSEETKPSTLMYYKGQENSLSHSVGLFDKIPNPFSRKSKVSDSRIPKAIPIAPQVHVEILKVKVDSQGNVNDSILGVTDSNGTPQEIVLVTLDGQLTHVWATSTAQSYKKRKHKTRGWITPYTPEGRGFKPHSLVKDKSSSVYGDGTVINMPYSIFFNQGIALHGTTWDHYKELGIKDSGGCSRLYVPNAIQLWNYVNPSGTEEIYSGAILNEIQSRVTVDVYGFEDTGADTRARLYNKYESAIPWIQQELLSNLATIKGLPAKKKKKK